MLGFISVWLFCFLWSFDFYMEAELGLKKERDIERKLKVEVEKVGGLCWKFLSTVSGVPDRICLFPGGRIVFVELKAPGEKPRPLQIRQMKRIRQLGFRVEVIDSEEGIKKLIEEVMPDGVHSP